MRVAVSPDTAAPVAHARFAATPGEDAEDRGDVDHVRRPDRVRSGGTGTATA
nr:hypothetical protein StreXyl84_08730 [Streptomyces sp. Xyl84]